MQQMQAVVSFDRLRDGRGRIRIKSVTGHEIGVEMSAVAVLALRAMMTPESEVRPT
jgi:hypothetical protein